MISIWNYKACRIFAITYNVPNSWHLRVPKRCCCIQYNLFAAKLTFDANRRRQLMSYVFRASPVFECNMMLFKLSLKKKSWKYVKNFLLKTSKIVRTKLNVWRSYLLLLVWISWIYNLFKFIGIIYIIIVSHSYKMWVAMKI